jgi:hypothetical protein
VSDSRDDVFAVKKRQELAKKINLLRFAEHDFNRSLRVWRKYIPLTEIFRLIVHERTKALSIALRSLIFVIVGTLWLSSGHENLTLRLAIVNLSVPASYVNFAVAISLFAFLINCINYFTLNEFVRVASNKLFEFDSPWALTLLEDGSNAWSLAWVRQFRFLTSSTVHQRLGTTVMWVVFLPILIILFLVYGTVYLIGVKVLLNDGVVSVDAVFTITAWLLASYPIALIFIICFPFTFYKNTDFVRWNFLVPLYRHLGIWPPRIDVWLAESRDSTRHGAPKTE